MANTHQFILALLLVFASNALGESIGESFRLSEQYGPGDRFMDIRLLGTLELGAAEIDGEVINELSGLAWDEQAQRLYGITDRARLFHFKPIFEHDILVRLELLEGHRLLDANGKPLRKYAKDSEGLELIHRSGRSTLLVSFERQPRAVEFTLQGQPIREHTLPKALQDPAAYSHPNKSLESVALHPKLGLITAPEMPLIDADQEYHRIYIRSAEGVDSSYRFPRYDREDSAITSITALPDGRLLILERTFSSIFAPVVIGLHLAKIPSQGDDLIIRTVALFDNGQGWRMDNYEGLTYLGNHRFLMVTDNNDFGLQRTLMTHFELLIP